MKMTRDELKSLIRECLVEVLAEGLGGRMLEAVRQSPARPQQLRRPAAPLPSPTRRPQHAANLMESILADTAATTLRAQSAHDAGATPGGGIAQVEQVVGTPHEIFGDAVADKWAALAFADVPSNSRS